MGSQIVVFGYGPVGRATVDRLAAQGEQVKVVQRARPQQLSSGASFQACDVRNRAATEAAVRGAGQVVVAIGFAYQGRVWRSDWPLAMENLVAACASQNARMVFVDNLYMYGPQRDPLREDMALTDFGQKPAVRADITKIWMAASAAGRVRATALRAPDFYGPGVTQSHLGELAFQAIGKGGRATLIAPPDMPHDFAYVPDIARAVTTLLEAPDDAFGQAWHVPCAPIRTCREILALGAAALDKRLRITALPMHHPSCGNLSRCVSSGTGPIAWIAASSGGASGPMRRLLKPGRRRPRCHFARMAKRRLFCIRGPWPSWARYQPSRDCTSLSISQPVPCSRLPASS
jgi:nucleoside-diphosphate-sugar epimerase